MFFLLLQGVKKALHRKMAVASLIYSHMNSKRDNMEFLLHTFNVKLKHPKEAVGQFADESYLVTDYEIMS